MKSDNPKTGEECLDVPERSVILLGLWDFQNHKFWGYQISWSGARFMKDFVSENHGPDVMIVIS